MLAAHVHPLRVPGTSTFPTTGLSHLAALLLRLAERAARAWCAVTGHSLAYRFEPGRVSLHCLDCGHTTSGWSTNRA